MGWAAITNARRGNWGLQASIIPRPAYAAARSGLFHPHPHPHAHMLLSQVSIDAVALSHSQSLRAAAQYSRTAASGAEAGGRSWEAELDDLMLMEAIRQSLAGQPGGASVAAPPGSGGAASWDLGVAAGSGGGVCAPDEAGGGGSSASAAEDEMADAITARLAEHVERSVRAQLARGRSSGPGTSTGAMPDVLLLPPAMADAAEEAAPDLAGGGEGDEWAARGLPLQNEPAAAGEWRDDFDEVGDRADGGAEPPAEQWPLPHDIRTTGAPSGAGSASLARAWSSGRASPTTDDAEVEPSCLFEEWRRTDAASAAALLRPPSATGSHAAAASLDSRDASPRAESEGSEAELDRALRLSLEVEPSVDDHLAPTSDPGIYGGAAGGGESRLASSQPAIAQAQAPAAACDGLG
eukprot:scaffold23167_cov79-Isochrysis_galbana.AAC.1